MPHAKILLADDEPRICKLVTDFLKKEGYSVLTAEDGKQALEIFQQHKDIDLVILDVMMPEIDGWAVCSKIRNESKVPIIMLTAKSQETDELFGFHIGADEYITKPFSPMVLVARVKALLRRIKSDASSIKNINGLEIDEIARIVKIDGHIIDMTPKEFELLSYLVNNKGIALSRDQILNVVWDYDYFGDPRVVDTYIKKLRAKLGSKANLIQTVRGLGYRFGVI